ncbi:SMR family transporter [Cohaesibacter intestini]|uniref:SMR family transporter n=1 Tax=Cohaesibacter intestini TaxID=2211145 RepID=UPI000DE830D9
MLSVAMKTLPLGTAYLIWTGNGAVGTFVVGIVILGNPFMSARVLAALLIVSGIITMKLASAASSAVERNIHRMQGQLFI